MELLLIAVLGGVLALDATSVIGSFGRRVQRRWQ